MRGLQLIDSCRQVQLNAYYQGLVKYPPGVRNLAGLIKFNDANSIDQLL